MMRKFREDFNSAIWEELGYHERCTDTGNAMKILLAEDDTFLADGLSMVLRDSGYSVDVENNGLNADSAVSVNSYDLLILDLNLPKLDGLDVLRRIRSRGQTIPILILTARDRLEERVRGLDLGANDYITKPFELPELEARIRALIRKDSWSNHTEVRFGNLTFNTVSRMAFVSGEPVELTAREVAVLEIFLQRVGAMLPKERITDLLSSWDEEVTSNAVGIIVHRLRKKLENSDVTIRALRGLGYRLEKVI